MEPAPRTGRRRVFWQELLPEDEDRTSLHRRARLLGLLYIAVYAGCFILSFRPLNRLSARWPELLSAAVHALIPPALGTAICSLTWPLFPGERRMMAAAFRQIAIAALVVFLLLQALVWGEREAQGLVTHFYAAFVLFPLLLGGGTALLLCYRQWKREGRIL